MKSATYRTIESFPEVEYHVMTAPITKSALDLADEIREKFDVKVSAQTISNYRKKLSRTKIKNLHKEKIKNIESLRFIIELLKEQLENIDDPRLKLRYIQEMNACTKELDEIIEDEIEYIRNS